MALIRSVRGYEPEIGNDTWLAENAAIIGNVKIGENCSIWYNAVIHGAIIEDDCLIGMGATILDNAVVGTGCIVAANALVLSNQKLEPNSVYAGVPAKRVKDVTPEQREQIIKRTARDYRTYASWYE